MNTKTKQRPAQGGYQAPESGERPSVPSIGSGVTAASVSSDEPRMPRLGETVLACTSRPINGQSEHAAIVTQVGSANIVNLFVLPSFGQPYPVPLVLHESVAPGGAMSWRFRD